jgi:copper(I)-binding protein
MMQHGGSNSAAYMTLINSGDTPDALIAAETDVAETVELHTVEMENEVMKMRPVPQIDVPAQGEQMLKPGGFHIMLLGIQHDLKDGETVTLTLTFEKSGTMDVVAPVQMLKD